MSNIYKGPYYSLMVDDDNKSHDCINNYRICKSDKDGTETELYEFLKGRGCCGFYDKLIYNDVTQTYYKFGFNHGH